MKYLLQFMIILIFITGSIYFNDNNYLQKVVNSALHISYFQSLDILDNNLVLNNVDSIILFAMLAPISVSIYTTYVFITRYLNEVSTKVELSVVNSFGNVFANNEEKC